MPPPDEAVVRLANPADVDALAGISGRAWNATYRGIIPDLVLREWIEGTTANWRAAFENQATVQG